MFTEHIDYMMKHHSDSPYDSVQTTKSITTLFGTEYKIDLEIAPTIKSRRDTLYGLVYELFRPHNVWIMITSI